MDSVKDYDGLQTVFTEQSASAGQLVAANFMDALSRLPGMDGAPSDVVSSCTQVRMTDCAHTSQALGDGTPTSMDEAPS